ncbi:hypothetical protein E4U30_001204 [Claviceps sp. LM220 group G6]|nr:hypothetical protein E4U30_001204 [Claviceps sp. LM220 group G6]KAG6101124.1 hypothetical protein E4U31_003751 [Claviceps sp. LM219 group G6]KAG6103107.1 hypothetical protein E4U14_006442 [Claviceps sp. LM454 group G7]
MSSVSTHRHANDRPCILPAKSAAKTAQIKLQNRRRAYLERHPSYFDSVDDESADPVLYERLIKHHQTPQERQAEGLTRGYARSLEADLARGESRLSALATQAAGEQPTEFMNAASPSRWRSSGRSSRVDRDWEEEGEQAPTKEQGRALWREFLAERFIHGGDEDFRYGDIDEDESLDGEARREEEEKWFEEEEEGWCVEERVGETGVQDF